jgi:hypothetical protein
MAATIKQVKAIARPQDMSLFSLLEEFDVS